MSQKDIVSFVLYGITGSGKSTFGNIFLDKNNAFKESANFESETSETIGKTGEFEGQKVYVIDSPGLEDSRGQDTKQLCQMTTFIKSVTAVQAFVVIIDFNIKRFDEGHIRLFKLMAQMYPGKKWYHHIAIVWSNYASDLSERMKNQKDNKRKQILEQIKSKIVPNLTEEEMNAIPQKFIDSIEAKEKENKESRDQIRDLIAWIAQLEPLFKTCGEIQDVDKDIKERISEEERMLIKENRKDPKKRPVITAMHKRTKYVLFNGITYYDDWEEVEGTREEEEKKESPLKIEIEEESYEENVGEERKEIDNSSHEEGFFGGKTHIEEGRIMQKRKKTTKRRYRKEFSDGRIEFTDWEIVNVEEDYKCVDKFKKKTEESASFFTVVGRSLALITPFLPLGK